MLRNNAVHALLHIYYIAYHVAQKSLQVVSSVCVLTISAAIDHIKLLFACKVPLQAR
jgi:hypothetical protein